MKISKIWTSVLALFIVGMLAGGLLTATLIRHHILEIVEFGMPDMKMIIEKEFLHGLDLTDAQKHQIDLVFLEYEPVLWRLMDSTRVEVKRLHKETTNGIRAVLTEEQITEFDRRSSKFRERMERVERKRRDKHASPGGS